jgi:hypothetical protein
VIHGFVREPNAKITSFDPPGSISTKAVSINAKGTITGYYQLANMSVHGFVRRAGGTIVSFDPPESTGTIVTAINNAGAITGSYTANGRTFGFVRRAWGKIESFDVPGSTGTFPTSINDDGAITGSYGDNSGGHGFVRSPEGMITSFDVPNEIGCVQSPALFVPPPPEHKSGTSDYGFLLYVGEYLWFGHWVGTLPVMRLETSPVPRLVPSRQLYSTYLLPN